MVAKEKNEFYFERCLIKKNIIRNLKCISGHQAFRKNADAAMDSVLNF